MLEGTHRPIVCVRERGSRARSSARLRWSLIHVPIKQRVSDKSEYFLSPYEVSGPVPEPVREPV